MIRILGHVVCFDVSYDLKKRPFLSTSFYLKFSFHSSFLFGVTSSSFCFAFSLPARARSLFLWFFRGPLQILLRILATAFGLARKSKKKENKVEGKKRKKNPKKIIEGVIFFF